MRENLFENARESLGGIVGARPACRRLQLILARAEGTKILFVLAGTLIDKGIELEVDLVMAGSQVDNQGPTVVTALEALDKALGHAEIEQVARPGV